MSLPPRRPTDAVLAQLESHRSDDVDLQAGGVLGLAFLGSPEARACVEAAQGQMLWENGLDPTLFPSALRLEQEVVGALLGHLGGGPEAVGSFTSGGTESVLLAMKAARDSAGVERPQVVLPASAHPCFHKAAAYLGLEVRSTPVDPITLAARPDAIEAAITARTVLIAGSAPSFAHGVVDPIGELGAVARRAGVRLHVDACMGGLLLPLWRELGVELPAFDLSVEGVTSLSVDLHKYGMSTKGASAVLYARAADRRDQIFGFTDWPGYVLVNPTVQSSRSLAPLAAAWAALHAYGAEGYREQAVALLEATRRLRRGIAAIDDLCVLGPSVASSPLFAVASTGSAARLAAELRARGVHTTPQPPHGGVPASVHVTVVPTSVERVDWLLDAFRAAAPPAAAHTPGPLLQGLEGLGLDTISDDALEALLGELIHGSGGDDRLALDEVLLALPPTIGARVVRAWAHLQYRPRP